MTTATPKCVEEVVVRLTGQDVWVMRLALNALLAGPTREEHVFHDIRAALTKLPSAHEPDGEDWACAAEPGAVGT